MMYKCLILSWIAVFFVFAAYAQKPDTAARIPTRADSIAAKHDSTTSKRYKPKITKEKVYHPDSTHNPHTALIHSLIIPGWGQLYNHQWWKVPIIYGGLALLGDVIIYNQQNYKLFYAEDLLRVHGIVQGRNSQLQGISDADVGTYTDVFRRDRDLGILGTLGAWGIQAIDAYVDAKFKHSFTMDNNLSIRIKPGIIGQPFYAVNSLGYYVPSLTITLTLK
ncbi:MAG TPA: DUF5683 domain-containing protein [Mucilaginibacter sp.]|jgi:hypothetical protein|nr:DUF5683 domain-containing protein [Mucilaginibacter sp.]